jgi:hypothetical protein
MEVCDEEDDAAEFFGEFGEGGYGGGGGVGAVWGRERVWRAGFCKTECGEDEGE